MAGDIKIEKSQIISGSQVTHSQITNVTSERASSVTPEMWQALFDALARRGQPQEVETARELKKRIDEGNVAAAQSLWQRVRGWLADAGNLAKIFEAAAPFLR